MIYSVLLIYIGNKTDGACFVCTVAAEENHNYRRLPPTWSLPVPNMPCQKVFLDAAEPEYIEVAQNAHRTASKAIKNIVQVLLSSFSRECFSSLESVLLYYFII